VLLIACINVAALVLTRNSARRSEIAIRLSLGAGSKRLVQQFVVESVVLVLLGTATGLVFAQGMAGLLARIELPLPIPIRLQITPDWRVLAYSAVLGLVATLVCGLMPAWQSLRPVITSNVHREGGARLRRLLIITQIAASVVLLITGSLFLRNLVNANSISPGFDVRHTLRADVNLPPSAYGAPQSRAEYIRQVLNQVKAIPGIQGVAAARLTPFTDNVSYGSPLKFLDNGELKHAYFKWNAVTPDYFRVMAIAFKNGTTFAEHASGENVVVVNDIFAQRFLNGRPPIGTTFEWVGHTPPNYRIIGVVGGTKTVTIGEDPQPQLYQPLDQIDNDSLRIQFVMKSAIPPVLQLEPVRRVLYRIDAMAGAQVETMYSSIGLAFLPSQVGAVLIGMTGVLGLLLAAIGLYGVMAYSVTRRTREIGIRMAIGASAWDVSRMVTGDVLKLVGFGSIVGLVIALFVTKPLAMFLVPGLNPRDPISFALVLLVMMLTGIVAAWGPARRAIHVDPNTALRYE
jgi:putative ABC transport system permease protein